MKKQTKNIKCCFPSITRITARYKTYNRKISDAPSPTHKERVYRRKALNRYYKYAICMSDRYHGLIIK